jgi:hypothetical protein
VGVVGTKRMGAARSRLVVVIVVDDDDGLMLYVFTIACTITRCGYVEAVASNNY